MLVIWVPVWGLSLYVDAASCLQQTEEKPKAHLEDLKHRMQTVVQGKEELRRQLEQQEKDIVNKKIDQKTLSRQKDIMTRLLEHEKAQREREFDNKRKSKEGAQDLREDPIKFFEYQRKKEKEAELLRTVPPSLKPYYKNRVNKYFGTFERPWSHGNYTRTITIHE